MVTESTSKKEISRISAEMSALMKAAIVQGTEEEWDSPLFPANSDINSAACTTVNNIIKAGEAGTKCVYDIYSDEEKAADPAKEKTAIIYSPAHQPDPEKPFVLILPGGAFLMVDILGEGLPEACEFNKLGFNVFIVKYRVGNQGNLHLALDDVNKAMEVILEAGKKMGINTDSYICTGSSAGGYLAGEWGLRDMGFGKFGAPAPDAMFLAYPASSLHCYYEDLRADEPEPEFEEVMNLYLGLILGEGHDLEDAKNKSLEHQIGEDYCPVYTVWNRDDPYVHEEGFMRLIENMEKKGVTYRKEIYETGGHGFGPGYGIDAEGWIERAVKFWEENVN